MITFSPPPIATGPPRGILCRAIALTRGLRRCPGLSRHWPSFARGLACVWMLSLAGGQMMGQPPGPSFKSDAYGFSYRLPPDWQMAPNQSVLPAAKQNAEQAAKSPGQVLSVSCAQAVFSAQHGKPASVIVVVALPFACYGRSITAKNLSDFATGVSDGLKQDFEITQPVYGSYTLGTHNFWVERAVGITKSHPQSEYTVEIACTVLKRNAACWLMLANDATALRDFENSLVTLDGEPPILLVPMDAFIKRPL